MDKLNRLNKVLSDNNFKLTKQRRLVFETFLKNEDKHMTIEEFYQFLSKNNPDIGIATVYRNVQLLTDLKILEKLTLDNGETRYELAINEDKQGHNHFICNSCNSIIEIREDLMQELSKTLKDNYDFKVLSHKIKFYGLCKNCNN